MIEIKKYIENNILLFDGAMGTYFSSINSDPEYRCEHANITSPNTIKEIHLRYLRAGAKAIKTNTFSIDVSDSDDSFNYKEIIASAYAIATDCVKGFDAYVFCDIGAVKGAVDIENYKKIVDEFILLGGKNFILETFSVVEHVSLIANYIKNKLSDAFIVAGFAVSPDGFTQAGFGTNDIIQKIGDKVDAVGFNCICGPHHMRNHLLSVAKTQKPLVIIPNASYPTVIGSRVRYESNPVYFAKQMVQIVADGARIIGGCCGTTPEFIAEMAKQIDVQKCQASVVTHNIESKQRVSNSAFYQKLLSREKPIAVELDPPFNSNIDEFMSGAKLMQKNGVDLLTVADCPIARARMDSSIIACKIKRELDMDVMPHLTCRDRNINASKALLFGLDMEKVSDVLIVTGDPIPSAQRSEVKTVYEFNSRMLINHINGLNKTVISSPFYLYGALNINARNFAVQLKFAKEKVENGANGFFTQPVLSQEAFDNLKMAKQELNVPIVGGIMPIVSYKNATFINNEIPGINVCDEIASLYRDKSKEECTALAVKISSTIASHIKPYIDGYYIITPFNRVDIVSQVVNNIHNTQ